MALDWDKKSLIKIKPETSSLGLKPEPLSNDVTSESILIKTAKTLSYPDDESRRVEKETKTQISETAEERQKTGKYLAIGVTLIMLFIAFYHTLLRHATVLAGLLAPAIIMVLYVLWLFYFAKRKKTQVSTV